MCILTEQSLLISSHSLTLLDLTSFSLQPLVLLSELFRTLHGLRIHVRQHLREKEEYTSRESHEEDHGVAHYHPNNTEARRIVKSLSFVNAINSIGCVA